MIGIWIRMVVRIICNHQFTTFSSFPSLSAKSKISYQTTKKGRNGRKVDKVRDASIVLLYFW